MNKAQELIQVEFKKRKDRNPNFSMRSFARWLQISPAQLSQMMAGKRAITLPLLKKVCDRLGLSPAEKRSFISAQAKEQHLPESKKESKTTLLAEEEFRIIADWYHLAILSLTKIPGSKGDPRWVARRLGISQEEANQAIVRLEKMGFLQTRPIFKQLSSPISVMSKVPSSAIRKYHKQNLNLALEKIDTVPIEAREFQSLTLVINNDRYAKVKMALNHFLDEIEDLCEDEEDGTDIYNLNIQFIPVGRT